MSDEIKILGIAGSLRAGSFNRSLLRAAKALVPDNHGVPGVMKNAVDWASRPPQAAVLSGKPVGIMGASPGMTGSARGQSQLRQAFEFTNSFCMPQPEILVSRAHEKFDAAGNLVDNKTTEFLVRYLVAFREWIRRFV